MFKRLLAELVGTTLLVIAATSVVITGKVSVEGMALSPAFAVFILIITLTHISGAHFNPAVSFTFYLLKELKFSEFLAYSLMQLSGSAIGSVAMLALFGDRQADQFRYGIPTLDSAISPLMGAVTELILTTILLTVILSMIRLRATSSNEVNFFGPLTIAITIFISILAFGPVTGTSINPARWFGPALIGGHFENAWIYIFPPFLASFTSLALSRYLSSDSGRNPS